MTIMYEEEILCPSCEHKQTVTVWNSINVTLHSELRERLFNEEINAFKCESCGYEALIDIPLLYNDMRLKFCVLYYPEEYLQHEDLYEDFSIEGKIILEGIPKMIQEENKYLYEPHIVFSFDEMINYIIFRETLYEKFKENQQ